MRGVDWPRVRLRFVSDLAPTTPVGHLREDEEVTFLPLETVWPDSRYDSSRLRPAQ